ncbi:hypothetical protein BDQ17DRAFT_1433677 [Cyathus striatus]|nr:hypothetical protein BDQ17DRAFT_1433677 [Cyathus striatus]
MSYSTNDFEADLESQGNISGCKTQRRAEYLWAERYYGMGLWLQMRVSRQL